LGAQDSLGGGGRYDYLVEDFGGPQTPAAGFALGLERTMLAMPGRPEPERRHLAFVVWMDESVRDRALDLLARLRAEGIPVRADFDAGRPKRQFRTADALRAACCVIVGPDELGRGVYGLKDLATGEQHDVPLNEVAPEVRALFRD
ncbi:ATP phosphoribosyltransferase regulatory subunit, partial [candidate division WOR-3 bacterium]|nr:ATP phosphoribosyltransferase regulatory subunit [candidate division WOR-3 bacterium]